MILIIDSYNYPHTKLVSQLHLKTPKLLNPEIIKTKHFTCESYFIHREQVTNLPYIKYYFSEIYEVKDNKVYYLNKKNNAWKIYNIDNNMLKDTSKINNINVNGRKKERDDVMKYFSVESGENRVIRDIDDEEL